MIKQIDKLNYLNRGYIKLYDLSDINDVKGIVTTVASISYGKESSKNPDKLYNLLIERGHESPFEFVKYPIEFSNGVFVFNLRNHGFVKKCNCYKFAEHKHFIATFKIKVPFFVARQIMRHRLFSFLEKSKRYTNDFPDMYFSDDEVKLYGNVNDNSIYDIAVYDLKERYKVGLSLFKPEIARLVLPVRMFTEMWMQGDYKAFAFFFVERLSKYTQKETRELANKMLALLKEYQPNFINNVISFLRTDYLKNDLFKKSRLEKSEQTIKLLEK